MDYEALWASARQGHLLTGQIESGQSVQLHRAVVCVICLCWAYSTHNLHHQGIAVHIAALSRALGMQLMHIDDCMCVVSNNPTSNARSTEAQHQTS